MFYLFTNYLIYTCKTLIIPSKTAEKQNTEPNTSAYSRKNNGLLNSFTDKFTSLKTTYKTDNVNTIGKIAYLILYLNTSATLLFNVSIPKIITAAAYNAR